MMAFPGELFIYLNEVSSSLSDDSCMGVFLPGLHLAFKAGTEPPPARNLQKQQYFEIHQSNYSAIT